MRLRILRLASASALAAGFASSGCRSAVSTHVTPDPIEGGWSTKKIRGIPVTVRVPTHLEVKVVERRFYQPGTFEPVVGAVSRFVCNEVREKDQVFMVDSNRPAAGKLTLSATLDNKKNTQFFSEYDAKIEDTTIQSITALIPGLPDVLGNLKKARAIGDTSGVTTPTDASLAMVYTDHIVAVKVFDVNAVDLTASVQEFVNTYVNCSTGCPTCTVAPSR